jgi:hypothetical protein
MKLTEKKAQKRPRQITSPSETCFCFGDDQFIVPAGDDEGGLRRETSSPKTSPSGTTPYGVGSSPPP